MSGDTNDPPKETADDVLYTVIKNGAGAGSLALSPLGPIVVELLSKVIQPSFARRTQSFLEDLAYRMKWLEKRVERFSPQNLSRNEPFVSTVLEATLAAGATHRQEKLEALRNAAINTALGQTPEDDIRDMFMRMIDQFTVLHIEALTILHEAKDRVSRSTLATARPNWGGSLAGLVSCLIERKHPHGMIEAVCQDLFNRGLIARDPNQFTGNPGNASWTTPLGAEFVNFVREPEELREYDGGPPVAE